jgi:uncharacterized protein (TIGR02996 family)
VATRTQKPKPPPAGYVGATTCGLVPDWCPDLAADPDTRALLRACHAADPDEWTPALVLADKLDDRGDRRAGLVRAAHGLWRAAADLAPAAEPWDYATARDTLAGVTDTVPGWRLTSLWGCLVAWHCPAGNGSGPIGRTWADERVRVVNRCCLWWSLGLVGSSAAWSQADAAWSQADAAGRQADAAGRQADAAGRQADAARRQAWCFAAALWPLCLAETPAFASAFAEA